MSLPSDAFLDTLGSLYEAAADPSRFTNFLATLCRLFESRYANFAYLDPSRPTMNMSILYGFEHHPLEDIQEGARYQISQVNEDPRVIYAQGHPGKAFRCTEVMPVAEFHQTAIYRELLHRAGVEHSIMVQWTKGGGPFGGLTIHRGPDQSPYTETDSTLFGSLVPHLRRAFAIQEKLLVLSAQVDELQSALDALPLGIILVDDEAKVGCINDAARQMLPPGGPVSIDGGLIQASTGVWEELVSAIRNVTLNGGHRLVTLPRSGPRPALQCLITRKSSLFPQLQTLNMLTRPQAILYLSDPEQALETREDLLQRMYGLTPAESAVAARVVQGLGPEEIAAEHGVGITTVRTQLRAAFAKTNTTRQSELVQAILGNPLWVAAQGHPE